MRRGTRKGFTLVELLVAIGLFSIAVSIAVGGFVRALRTQRQLVGLISANSNASLAIEQIARELRTGSGFDCEGGINPCSELSFLNDSGEVVTYREASSTLERGVGGQFSVVTAANVRIRDLQFTLLNRSDYPPRIVITMGVSSPTKGIEESVTNIQTTVSGRRL